MPVTVGVGLKENGAGRVFRCVSGNGERGREVGELEDRLCKEEAFKRVEGRLARGGPIPGEVLLGEVKEGAGDIGVVGNEPSIEVGESKERADIFHLGWGGPTRDSVEFNWVHGQLAGFDDHSEVFHLVSGELAFFEF